MQFNLPSGKTLRWIGDFSLQDADAFMRLALSRQRVLEFGAGGSTQILAQCKLNRIISVETDLQWITLTQQRLCELKDTTTVEFIPYEGIQDLLHPTGFSETFDFIFVDGVDHLRREFAINTWPLLDVGGIMVFHDTKRFQDFQNAAWVMQLFHNEIEHVDVNVRASDGKSSNLTVIYKKKNEPYENWNYTENKPLWAYGMPGQPIDQPLWSPNQ